MKFNEKEMLALFNAESPAADHTGMLFKRAEHGSGVKQRWFVLKGNLLFYAKTPVDRDPIGFILLENCRTQAVTDSSIGQNVFSISFLVPAGGAPSPRTYLLSAQTLTDMREWMLAIDGASFQLMRHRVEYLQKRVRLLEGQLAASAANDSPFTSPKPAAAGSYKASVATAAALPSVPPPPLSSTLSNTVPSEVAMPISPSSKGRLSPHSSPQQPRRTSFGTPASPPMSSLVAPAPSLAASSVSASRVRLRSTSGNTSIFSPRSLGPFSSSAAAAAAAASSPTLHSVQDSAQPRSPLSSPHSSKKQQLSSSSRQLPSPPASFKANSVPASSVSASTDPPTLAECGEDLIELAISCRNLTTNAPVSADLPNPFVSVSMFHADEWFEWSRTEIIESQSSPDFVMAPVFHKDTMSAQLRFDVYSMENYADNSIALLCRAECSMAEIVIARPDAKELSLSHPDDPHKPRGLLVLLATVDNDELNVPSTPVKEGTVVTPKKKASKRRHHHHHHDKDNSTNTNTSSDKDPSVTITPTPVVVQVTSGSLSVETDTVNDASESGARDAQSDDIPDQLESSSSTSSLSDDGDDDDGDREAVENGVNLVRLDNDAAPQSQSSITAAMAKGTGGPGTRTSAPPPPAPSRRLQASLSTASASSARPDSSGLSQSYGELVDAAMTHPVHASRLSGLSQPAPQPGPVIVKTYRFVTVSDMRLKVIEEMSESPLSFTVPHALLMLFVAEDKRRLLDLELMGRQAAETWEARRQLGLREQMERLAHYQVTMSKLGAYRGMSFKPSAQKKSRDLEFLPTNLHMQRMRVCETNSRNFVYEAITVGAFAAHAAGFKKGGLRRASQMGTVDMQTQGGEEAVGSEHLHQALSRLDTLQMQLETHIRELADLSGVVDVQNAKEGGTSDARAQARLLKSSQASGAEFASCVRQILSLLTGPNVVQAVAIAAECTTECTAALDATNLQSGLVFSQVPRLSFAGGESLRHSSSPGSSRPASMISNGGTTTATTPTASAAASVTSPVISRAGGVAGASTGSTGRLKSMLDNLVATLAIPGCTASDVVTAALKLSEETTLCVRAGRLQVQVALLRDADSMELCYRHDVVFSQALTTLIAAILSRISLNGHDPHFFSQLQQCGFLLHLSSLLSTFGDELHMLEDMVVAIELLKRVRVRIIDIAKATEASVLLGAAPVSSSGGSLSSSSSSTAASAATSDMSVWLSGGRADLIVTVGVPSLMLTRATALDTRRLIRVVPALFTQGINEAQTIAHWTGGGDAAMQDNINLASHRAMANYVTGYRRFVDSMGVEEVAAAGAEGSIESLLSQLTAAVHAKKTKNTAILTVSEELARAMNGGRVTVCKSAKDRTSMAVTLEQASILQHRHSLKPTMFAQALDAMRSRGTRRDNVLKNTGDHRYGFNALQYMTLPKLYRPPRDTIGSSFT